MPLQSIKIPAPVKGVNTVVNREGQPPDTCWSALNVLPYDKFGRRRVAQRPGMVKQFTTQLTSTGYIQGMLAVPGVAASSTSIPFYTENFSNLSEFTTNWTGLPAGWTVSSTGLTMPSTYAPVSSTAPLFFNQALGGSFGPSGYQFTVNVNYTNITPNDSGPTIWCGLAPSSTTHGTFNTAGAGGSPAWMGIGAATDASGNFQASSVIHSFNNHASAGSNPAFHNAPVTSLNITYVLTINKVGVSNSTADGASDTGLSINPAVLAGMVFCIFVDHTGSRMTISVS